MDRLAKFAGKLSFVTGSVAGTTEKKNIYIVAVLIIAKLRIVLLDDTVLSFKSPVHFWVIHEAQISQRSKPSEHCPSMTSQETRPRSHYARGFYQSR